MDDRLMEFAGITADQFTTAVKANPSDEIVAKWFMKTAKPHTPAELNKWSEMMLNRGPSTPEKKEYFNKLRDAVDPSRTDGLGRPARPGRRPNRSEKYSGVVKFGS
jgi:hypothetical protein